MLEKFFAGLGSLLSTHLKGGVLWVWFGLGGIILVMWGYIQFLEGRYEKVKAERDLAISQSAAKTQTINSQSRQAQRKEQAAKEQANVEAEINSAPNPIDYSYQWLLDKRSAEADNPDE